MLEPPDRDADLGPVEVELGADQVDRRPVRLLDDVGRPDRQRLAERLVERALSFGLDDFAREIAGDQRECRLPLVLDPPAEERGQRALAVEVDGEHAQALERRRLGQMGGERGLADAALEVRHRDDARLARGVHGWGRGRFAREMARERQRLVEGEAALPAGLGRPLRQLGPRPQRLEQHPGLDPRHLPRHLGEREPPELLAAVRRMPLAGERVPPGGGGIGQPPDPGRAERPGRPGHVMLHRGSPARSPRGRLSGGPGPGASLAQSGAGLNPFVSRAKRKGSSLSPDRHSAEPLA